MDNQSYSSELDRVLKYSRQYPHEEEAANYGADFHQNLVENWHQDLPHLVYSDWLEEHGLPITAKFIRKWVDYRNAKLEKGVKSRSLEADIVGDRSDMKPATGYSSRINPAIVTLHLPTYNNLRPKSENVGGFNLAYPKNGKFKLVYTMYLPKEEAKQLHDQLVEEYNQHEQ